MNDRMDRAAQPRRFTGRHMAAILIAFFAVIIAVNLVMARLAISSFGGVVVENSYVAGQHFNRWLDEAASEQALGWSARSARTSDSHVRVTLSGVPDGSIALTATARHPLGQAPDQLLHFTRARDGTFLSAEILPPGRWRLRIEMHASGHQWRTEGDVR